MRLRSVIERKLKQSILSLIVRELDRISKLPRFTIVVAHLFGMPLNFMMLLVSLIPTKKFYQ